MMWWGNILAVNAPENSAKLIARRTLAMLPVVDPRLITDSSGMAQLAEGSGCRRRC